MTSKTRHDEAYVLVWLPGATEPIVTGHHARDGLAFLVWCFSAMFVAV
jgi:hypothetical protein